MQIWVYVSYLVGMVPFAIAIDKLGNSGLYINLHSNQTINFFKLN